MDRMLGHKKIIFSVLGMTVLVAVLGAVVWRTQNLEKVFFKPKATGGTVCQRGKATNPVPANSVTGIPGNSTSFASWSWSPAPAGLAAFVEVRGWDCNPAADANCRKNVFATAGPFATAITTVKLSDFKKTADGTVITALDPNKQYWWEVQTGSCNQTGCCTAAQTTAGYQCIPNQCIGQPPPGGPPPTGYYCATPAEVISSRVCR